MALLGEVQPSDKGVILQNPWPDDVQRACDQVAGRNLDRRVHDAVWRALNPPDPTCNYVGVLKAA